MWKEGQVKLAGRHACVLQGCVIVRGPSRPHCSPRSRGAWSSEKTSQSRVHSLYCHSGHNSDTVQQIYVTRCTVHKSEK